MLNKFTSKIRILRGGETMKTLGLVLSIFVLASGFASAASTTVDIFPGFNYIGLPIVPFDAGTNGAANPESIITSNDLWAAGLLHKWDAASQGDVAYDPDGGTGWNMLLGEGYSYYWEAPASFTYEGVENGVPSNGIKTDMWISLPGNQMDGNTHVATPDGGGWHLVANPFDEDIAVDSGNYTGDRILFTDGSQMKSWADAVDAGWVDPVMHGWDGASQSVIDILPYNDPSDSLLRAHAYWLLTYQDNLAMIVLANNK